jgi:hypothetical protein
MVKACAKFGARRASVRDRRQKEVMVRKRDNLTKEKEEKKNEQNKNATLFRNDGDTLTRTSEPFQCEPRLDLWTRSSPGFALSFEDGISYICTSQKKVTGCWHKRVVLGIT